MVDKPSAVTVSLHDLQQGSVPFSTLEDAFGPGSQGILIVKDLPTKFLSLRIKLLSFSSYLAKLPPRELDGVTDASSNYEVGWSHGKEKLKAGQYDTLKGSFYVNCQSFYLQSASIIAPDAATQDAEGHYHTAPNLWPSVRFLPGFRETFEELCTLVIDTGALVARACDQYASKYVQGYKEGYLEQMVKTSSTTKARLLHYFPPDPSPFASPASSSISSPRSSNDPGSPKDIASDPEDMDWESAETSGSEKTVDDSWCATHLDDGCLTALTSALHVDESVQFPPSSSTMFPCLPSLPTSPDPAAGLYIRSRDSSVVKVDIPNDCLAFQTGEALQLITGGAFRAVPHFVKGPKPREGEDEGRNVARNTLAVFMQPDLDDIIERSSGMTFGQFATLAVQNHS